LTCFLEFVEHFQDFLAAVILAKLVKTTNPSLLENKKNLANRAVLNRCELLREYKAPRKMNQCILFGLVHS
jgi:hypothetical protein